VFPRQQNWLWTLKSTGPELKSTGTELKSTGPELKHPWESGNLNEYGCAVLR
jgi:hypothetical protein